MLTIDAVNLVPGDVIIIKFGDIVPADIKILPEEGGGAGDEIPMQVSTWQPTHKPPARPGATETRSNGAHPMFATLTPCCLCVSHNAERCGAAHLCLRVSELDVLACCVFVAGRLQIDQAALTGESLPVKKFTGDVAFSGSAVKTGERHAVVYATGVNTFFGRAAALIAGTNNEANIQVRTAYSSSAHTRHVHAREQHMHHIRGTLQRVAVPLS